MEFLQTKFGKIAYKHCKRENPVGSVIFLGGFGSEMSGTKACHLGEFCRLNNISYTKFDYFGHGNSDGEFVNGNISIWLQNAEDIFSKFCERNQILIGSSMGGWLMLLLAKKHHEKIKGLIGIGAAPDFTEEFYTSLSEEEKCALHKDKVILKTEDGYQYLVTESLIQDAKKNHLVLKDIIHYNGKVILLHGIADDVVHYSRSFEIVKKISSEDVVVQLVKNGGHNLSEEKNLKKLSCCVLDML